jgi:hypothetical protein
VADLGHSEANQVLTECLVLVRSCALIQEPLPWEGRTADLKRPLIKLVHKRRSRLGYLRFDLWLCSFLKLLNDEFCRA